MNTLAPQAVQAHREILWNVSHPANTVVMYLLFAVSVVVLAFAIFQRIRLWALGKADLTRTTKLSERIFHTFRDVILQRRVNQDSEVKSFHALIFWGFLVLLCTTIVVLLHHDLKIQIYQGEYYLALTILSDVFGLLLFIGLLTAYYRRSVIRPDKLHSMPGDNFQLLLLMLLVVQGFLLEALRIYVTNDPWRLYSPVGHLLSLSFWSLSLNSARILHFVLWWFHAVTVFVWIALLPYTKFFHILASSANLFFQRLSRPKGSMRYDGDIEALMETALSAEDDAEFTFGVKTIEDLSWKQRLDLDACTSCGRCQEVCPAYRSGKPLSPKWLILDTRDHLLKLQATGMAHKDSPNDSALHRLDRSLLSSLLLKGSPSINKENKADRAQNPLVQDATREVGMSLQATLAGDVMDEDVFWACTTCRACMEVCPVGIEHVDLIMDVRRSLTLIDGAPPQEAQASLRAIESRGNPFGPADTRSDWTQGLNVPVLEAGDEVDVLYWVGCISAFDKRKQKIARSMAQILNASGYRWGILGNSENCTGDPARRLGEENLFQTSAKKNIETLRSIRFSTMVANCPHCFNTLKNEYPDIGDFSTDQPLRVLHHSVFIQELLATSRLSLKKELDVDITYHDPCYLGRHNDTYNEPREVLVQLSKGKKSVTEMEDSRERGMCCGAGGGHYLFDMKIGERINVIRVEQAAKTNAPVIATACPFCLQMMEDGTKLTERENILVRDIAELVAEGIEAST